MVFGKHFFAWAALGAALFFCGCAAKKQALCPEAIAYQQGAQETAKEFKDTYAGGLYYQKRHHEFPGIGNYHRILDKYYSRRRLDSILCRIR